MITYNIYIIITRSMIEKNRIMSVCRVCLVFFMLGASVQRAVAQQDSVIPSCDSLKVPVEVERTGSPVVESVPAMQKPVEERVVSRRRMRVPGFRVQVYYGGNDQKSKLQARSMAERAKIWFEELSVYTQFSSPHWICRVGDFRTREEAMEVLQAMRESGRFPRAIIVKTKINITENELRREEPDSCGGGDTTACKTDTATVG